MNKAQLKSQRGSVVIEALIAILLFSIGVMAVIGLQATSISNVSATKYRTDASMLADKVIGEMWVANRATLVANYSSPSGAAYLNWASAVVDTLPEVAQTPLYLPTISFASVGGGQRVTVTLHWRESSEQTAHQYVTTAEIN